MDFDWEKIFNEGIEHLQNLIRIDTTNPPGNEINAVLYLKEHLEKEGFNVLIFEPIVGRGNIITKLEGDKSKPPIVLSSHLDVVGANPKEWEYHPFSGTIANGYIWGRGAVDMKNMTVYNLMTMLLLKRLNIPLKRDVIFVAVADEETGSDWGMKWLVENKPELLKSEYALNEVGGFTIHIGKGRVYPIQVVEKGYVWIRVKVKGAGGHGSIPQDNNAMFHISKIINKLSHKSLPLIVTPVSKEFINNLASQLSFPNSIILKSILNPITSNFILKNLIPDKDKAKVFSAMLHNTINPTCINSNSSSVNVMSTEVNLILDCRILPGFTPESFLENLKKFIGLNYEFEVMKSGSSVLTPANTPFFEHIEKVIKENDPGSITTQYLNVGITDTKFLNKLGIKTYGFSPVKLSPDIAFSSLFHGINERIPINGFNFGIKVMFELVKSFCEK